MTAQITKTKATEARSRSRYPRGCLALALALVVLLAAIGSVQVQQGHVLLAEGTSGPYRITLQASSRQPYVGSVFLWTTVQDAATHEAVTDAQVQILTEPPEGADPGWAYAVHQPDTPGTYTTDLNVDAVGPWRLIARVEGGAGEGTLTTELQVRSGDLNSQAGRYAWAGVIGVLVLGTLYIWWSARKAQNR